MPWGDGYAAVPVTDYLIQVFQSKSQKQIRHSCHQGPATEAGRCSRIDLAVSLPGNGSRAHSLRRGHLNPFGLDPVIPAGFAQLTGIARTLVIVPAGNLQSVGLSRNRPQHPVDATISRSDVRRTLNFASTFAKT